MSRAVPEWIAKSDDEKIPARVRLRVWERHHGKCHLTGRKIMVGDQWDIDHVVALVNGGEHRESNLAPALRHAHRVKTAADVAEKAAARQRQAKHIGLRKSEPSRLRSRGFPKRPKPLWRSASELARMEDR